MSESPTHEALMRRALAEIRQLRARVAELEADATEPVAVIGIGCRYPGGAHTPDAFWDSTRDGQDAIGPYPAARRAALAGMPQPDALPLGGFLDDVDGFDGGFFGLAAREVHSMDPRQRLLLEVCHEGLEDALVPASRMAGSRTGLFLGLYNDDFSQLHVRLDRPEGLDSYLGTGTSHAIAAARLAYQLDLKGPALTVDAACASSLAAVHLACASLRRRESDLALAAGVNLILSPLFGMITERMGMMAPDGRCKPFDARADGFVRSEGCGVVVLKRLADALADGDPIRAVIRGSAMNQDGATNGITAPNGRAQQAVIEAALAEARIAAADVGYVECHGTGTPLGDPVETDALARVYGVGRRTPCALGSVKGNIGHTEAAAGVAGLIRAVLAIERREIPGVAHFRSLNPHIDLGTGLTVPGAPVRWTDASPHAAVSAFGWSGSNVHVVLGPAPAASMTSAREPAGDACGTAGHLLPLSAASADALGALARRTAAWLADAEVDIAALCRAAWHGRDQRRHRLVVRGASTAELARRLSAWCGSDTVTDGVAAGAAPAVAGRTVLVFSGQGGQWPGMGRRLLAEDAVFRDAFLAISQAAEAVTERPLVDELQAADRFDRIDVVQPLSFAVQVALATWLRAHGVRIDAVVGHSMGEVAAACVAGALSAGDAARVIVHRSRLLKTIAGRGGMLLVELSAADAEAALAPWRDAVTVAVINGPRTTVLSGETAALDSLRAGFEARGVFCRTVKVDVASHSPQTDALLGPLAAELAGLVAAPLKAGVRFYSTLTAGPVDGQALDAGYWCRNVRAPVRFAETVQRLVEDGHGLFIEVSAHPVLGPALHDGMGTTGTAIGLLRRDDPEPQALLDALARIHSVGGIADAKALYAQRPAVRLPILGWTREPCGRAVLPVAGAESEPDAELHDIAWVALPEAPAPAGRGRWLLLEGGPGVADGLAEALRQALAAAGASVAVVRLDTPQAIDAALTAATLADCSDLVYLAGRAAVDDRSSDPMAAQAWQASAALRLTQRLAALVNDGEGPALWLVTRGAEVVASEPRAGRPGAAACGQGALRGFLRVAATEQVPVALRLVDLAATPQVMEGRWLAQHLLIGGDEDHVALREGRRLAARRVRRARDARPAAAPSREGAGVRPRAGAARRGRRATPARPTRARRGARPSSRARRRVVRARTPPRRGGSGARPPRRRGRRRAGRAAGRVRRPARAARPVPPRRPARP